MATIREVIEQMSSSVKKEDKGVGDTLKRITSAVGVKPCGGCTKRAAKLNEKFPYNRK